MTPKIVNPRKKATAGIIFLVLVLMVWQISSLFGKAANSPPKISGKGGGSVAVAQAPAGAPAVPAAGAAPAMPAALGSAGKMPSDAIPKKAQVVQATPMTEQETDMMQLKAVQVKLHDTQVKYLEAINELQLLKVKKDIANTDKDISAANESKVESDKKIIEMLSGVGSGDGSTDAGNQKPQAAAIVNSTSSLVSITELQHRWAAVVSSGGALYNVSVGDVLPSDGSTVVGITKDSVTLQKDGVRKKLSLVPII